MAVGARTGAGEVAGHANRFVGERLDRPGRRAVYAVLASLDESGPASQAELARRLGIDRGDLVSVIEASITAAGRRTLADLEHEIEAVADAL
jgi:hypothetical protein